MIEVDKSNMRDSMGGARTQSLILELGYNADVAVYTLKNEDFEYKGKLYHSLKQLYLEMGDPTEYLFANTYFTTWDQWLRITNNKQLTHIIDGWRRELELKIRAEGIQDMFAKAKEGDRIAIQWVAERGWEKKVGRPSRAEVAKQAEFEKKVSEDFGADIVRLNKRKVV